jgi:hypothetical protein
MGTATQQVERGHFFAVDRRVWAHACAMGLNPAVAYLILARFSGRDQRTTAASTQAVMTHAGLGHTRAKAAIQALVAAGVVDCTQGGIRPRYVLRAAADIPGLLSSGDPDADWIWLPNSLVTGAASEVPPVERVRQVQDVMTLRLFVDLYHAQNLVDDGGVSRRHIGQVFERTKLGEHAQYAIWGFVQRTKFVGWTELTNCHHREVTKAEKKRGLNPGADFFVREQRLTELGLIEWVPCLFESDSADAEMLHPCGQGGTGSIEDRLGTVAHAAGLALLAEWQCRQAEDQELIVVPAPRHFANVAMVGVARLRYRPHTSKTAAWWAELQAKADGFLRGYREMEATATRRARSA